MSELAAPLAYFGAKRLLAPEIVSHFGAKHEIFYDLFCGSCAILFAKPPCRQEIASEKNPDVVNLLRCLSRPAIAKKLHEWASMATLSENAFEFAAKRMKSLQFIWIDDSDVCPKRAWNFLMTSWQGPSGLAGTTAKPRFAKRNTASGGSTAARWRSVAESIPAWHERLRNVEFRNADAFEILEDVPDREGVVCYVDSPYFQSSRKGGNYTFDMTDDQLRDLAIRLRRFTKTRVVVSYYECPDADECYAGWRKVRLTAARKLGNTSGGETPSETAGEVLYVNQ